MTEDSDESLRPGNRTKKGIIHTMQRLRYSNYGKLDPNSEEYRKHFGAMEERNNAKVL